MERQLNAEELQRMDAASLQDALDQVNAVREALARQAKLIAGFLDLAVVQERGRKAPGA